MIYRIEKKTGHRTVPCGTSLVTSLYADLAHTAATVYDLPVKKLSI